MAKKKDRNKKDDTEDLEIRNRWKRYKEPLVVRDYQWRVIGWRGNDRTRVNLGPMVTSISWEDALIQRVSISLTDPNPDGPLRIGLGHQITILYRASNAASWTKLFTLRVIEVSQSVEGEQWEIQAADELEWLKRSKDDFEYRKGKGKSKDKRPKGWYAHQIARDVAKRYGLKVGHLAKGKKRIEKLSKKNASPLSIIEEAYKREREETGYKYVIRMRNGKLNVTRLRRSKELLVYGGQALDGQITRRLNKKLATQLTVRGQIKDDGSEKKQTVKVKANKKVQRRYGYVHDFWNVDEPSQSKAKLRRKAKRELADRQKPDEEVSLTVPGYPGLQRGDAIRVSLKREGMVDLVYVTGATHTVSAGDYTTDLTLSFDEFYIDKEGEKIREKKCKKAKKNDRKPPKYCRENFDPFAPASRRRKPKARNRGDRR